MKNTIIIIVALLFSALFTTRTNAQPQEPKILVLSPYKFTYEKQFEAEVKRVNKELSEDTLLSDEYIVELTESAEFKSEPENIQQMLLSQINFLKDLDASKYATLISSNYLMYRFYEHFEETLVFMDGRKTVGELSELGIIATKTGMQYILNFPEIRLYKKGGDSYADISIQLYDDFTKTIVIEDVFTGDSSNPGFEFSCTSGSLECMIHNALAEGLRAVINRVAEDNPVLKKQRQLTEDRQFALFLNYYGRPYDESFLDEVIQKSDTTIVREDMYQLLTDPTGTKFVAFFISETPNDITRMNQGGRDSGLVNIISSTDFTDSGFFENMPQTYAYTVVGVKHDGKWYYKKQNSTYFDTESIEMGKVEFFCNLTDWDFFNEDDVTFNPGFWEGALFPKVISAFEENREEIEWYRQYIANSNDKEDSTEYGNMIGRYAREDKKNKDYLGLYKIVADQLKKEKEQLTRIFKDSIGNNILEPFFKQYCLENDIPEYRKLNGRITMIYPEDRSVILSPIVLDHGDDNRELRFFVLLPGNGGNYSVYEWVYFEPTPTAQKGHYGKEIIDRLSELTKWNFSYDTLDDPGFWENYILSQSEQGGYRYLIHM